MLTFLEWLEAVQTHTLWSPDKIGNVPGQKDVVGFPKMAAPGFRDIDKNQILKEKDEVERYLDQATSRLGVNWHIIYLEPTGYPETPSAPSQRQMKQAAGQDWERYAAFAHQTGQEIMGKGFQQQSENPNQPPANPQNTIVYVKPTSRVHTLGRWQQLHNIGHAIWGHAREHLAKFIAMLRKTIFEVQQQIHDPDVSNPEMETKPPTWSEIVVVLARLLDLKSFQRVFNVKAGQMDDPKVRANTALNNIMEAMFEFIATYLRNKGKLYLRPRGEVAGNAPDRIGEMEPNAEVVRKFGVRPWVWKAMESGAVWQTLNDGLTKIIDEAILDCVWAKVGGPIYATQGYITTEP
jgi:hypothetical protein